MGRASFRELLKPGEVVFAPGAWDALSALLAEQAGFRAVCSSGFAVSAGLGLPDAELYSVTENVEAVRRMADVTTVPIVADIDTGYGNAINVQRTIRSMAAAGAGAVFMEDQESPKRCPICVGEDTGLIPVEEAAGKIRAAVDARPSDDLVIIARTDASGEAAIERARAYADAGADLVMPVSKSFSTVDEVAACHEACGRPLMLSLTPSTWVERDFDRAALVRAGVQLAVYPLQSLYAAVTAMRQRLAELHEAEYAPNVTAEDIPHKEFVSLIGFPEVEELEQRYLPPAPAAVG